MPEEPVMDAATAPAQGLEKTFDPSSFEQRWYVGWEKKGWRNASKQPVANQDLWVPLLQEYHRGGQVDFRWVRGHAGDPMNDMVDRLATEAARTQSGRRGSEPPPSLGPADKPGPRATSSTPPPDGMAPRCVRSPTA